MNVPFQKTLRPEVQQQEKTEETPVRISIGHIDSGPMTVGQLAQLTSATTSELIQTG